MCFSNKKHTRYKQSLNVCETPNLPYYGWWHYCEKCTLPTYHEDRICNTCKKTERIKKRRRMRI